MARSAGTVLSSTMPSRALLDGVGAILDTQALLSPAERLRIASLGHSRDREDFVAARLLTRWLLVRLLRGRTADEGDIDEWSFAALSSVSLGQRCARCGGPHGRPFVDVTGVGVSWAHARGHVAAAVGPGRVGVDVEPTCGGARGVRPTRLGSGDPAGSLISWVRGEAVVKGGHGRVDDLFGWSLDVPAAPRGRRYWLAAGDAPRPRRPVTLRRVPSLVITDVATADTGPVVCSVAASAAAVFELPRWS